MTDFRSPPRDDLFDCNICLETASEPVVTLCGHIYCWGCIYKWLEVQEGPQCPICKASIARERMVPIYGRGRAHIDPRSREVLDKIPTRPPGAGRTPATAPAASEGTAGGSATAAVAHPPFSLAAATADSGFDVVAALFGLGVVHVTSHPTAMSHPTQARGALSSEEEQQAILSRLLLLLGSFVILCLLIF